MKDFVVHIVIPLSFLAIVSFLLFVVHPQLTQGDREELSNLQEEISELENERAEIIILIESNGELVHFRLSEQAEFKNDLSIDMENSKRYIKNLKTDIERLKLKMNNLEQRKEDA